MFNAEHIETILQNVPSFEGLTAEERKNATINKLTALIDIIPDMVYTLDEDVVPTRYAAAFFLLVTVTLAQLADVSLEDIGTFAVEKMLKN